MPPTRSHKLDRPVEIGRDHVLGNPDAVTTLVEYGSYTCPHCHAVHQIVARLRERFGDRMRYVFRQLPTAGRREDAERAAQFAEYAGEATGRFWPVHDALMRHVPTFEPHELEEIAARFGVSDPETNEAAWQRAAARVEADHRSAERSGAVVTPTFFINGRRYEGAWDESELAEAMLGSLGHRLQAASLDFVRWGPSTGVLLVLASVIAVVLTNSGLGSAFTAIWRVPLELRLGDYALEHPLIDWINDGLLSIFFLVVGLEVKRELTVGRLATRQTALLPIAAAFGGMVVPAITYLLIIPAGPLTAGWGLTMTTDTAFAVALMVLLGDRVPVDLRVFLTAAVIMDDLVAIIVIALFYSGAMDLWYLGASAVLVGLLVLLNRSNIYRPLPYVVIGLVLWVCLEDAGLHATLAGVILAIATPARPPANLEALMTQAQLVIEAETSDAAAGTMRHSPSAPALRALDAIHDRIESPTDRLLRTVEPWSSYLVLPIFALANAGVAWSTQIVLGHERMVLAIVLGLVLGKPVGIVLGSMAAVRLRIARKPSAYTWSQLSGAGVLAGIGFTMSLFIASQAFPVAADFDAAKIAIFVASLIAGSAGVLILWLAAPREAIDETDAAG
jgi:NhaA family Na+:H+ antiporter